MYKSSNIKKQMRFNETIRFAIPTLSEILSNRQVQERTETCHPCKPRDKIRNEWSVDTLHARTTTL